MKNNSRHCCAVLCRILHRKRKNRGFTEQLAAYNGWNTADNAIGFAIAQGMLAPQIPREKQLALMRERILDDWYYQSNARRIITEELEKAKLTNHKYNLDDMAGEVQKKSRKIMRQLAVNYDITAGTTPRFCNCFKTAFMFIPPDVE